mgnify:CR=1 FL=1
MKDFNVQTAPNKTNICDSFYVDNQILEEDLDRYAAFVGLDVHKDSISVAISLPGRSEPEYYGIIASDKRSVEKMFKKIVKRFSGELVLFCYEAGPTGYALYRQLKFLGADCQVVAPSLLPRKPGDRIKTDRKDCINLSRNCRNGDVTVVWVPDQDQEAMRDLTRARDDMKGLERKTKQQLNGFVLRHGHIWPKNKTRWTKGHYNWLESIKLEQPWLQIVLQEYIDAVKAACKRVDALTNQLMKTLPQWSLHPIVESLVALRGIDKLAAVVLLAELGDISRFSHPRQLMAFLGLVPTEHSSGNTRRQGGITRTGNGHARRMLVESAWSYRFPARQTMHLKRKAASASEEAKEIAWQAQKRLCGRYRYLIESGKNQKTACIAVARELAGFIWDIVRREMPHIKQAA